MWFGGVDAPSSGIAIVPNVMICKDITEGEYIHVSPVRFKADGFSTYDSAATLSGKDRAR